MAAMPEMRVGRDVGDRLVSRIVGGLKLAPDEHVTTVVRLHGRKPSADCLVITNARLMTIESSAEPMRLVKRQVLADEIETWALARKFRSRLNITSGYHRKLLVGSGISTLDDDVVEDGLTALAARGSDHSDASAIRALRARAHWISGAHGRAVYVLDRSPLSQSTANAFDLDMIDGHLAQFDHWPASEVRRHLELCLPAGGCFLATLEADGPLDSATLRQIQEVAAAVSTVDAARLRRTSTREADVLQKLMSVLAHIRASPVWQSNYLDDQALRIDLNAEVRQIALGCHRAAGLRQEIGEPPARDSATGGRAAAVHNASVESLDAVVEQLDQRVDALAAYRDRLRVLSRELGDGDIALRIDAAADKVSALVTEMISTDGGDGELLDRIPRAREAGDDAVPQVTLALRDEVAKLRNASAS